MKKFIPGLLAMLLCLGMATGCNIGLNSVSDSSAPASTESATESATESTETPDSVESTDNSVEDSSVEDSSVEDSSVENSSEDSSVENSSDSSEEPEVHQHEIDLTDVKDYLVGTMNNKDLDTRANFTVINTYSFFGETAKYDIAWSVDVEGVSIEEGDAEDTVVISELDEDTPYVLTATITDPDGCHSTTVTFNGTALKALSLVPTAITAKPVENTAYKLYVYQSTKAADCYFTGEMSGFYFRTSELYTEGVDLYAEYVDADTFNLYFTKDGAKTYIGVQEGWNSSSSHWTYNVVMGTEAPSSFAWNEELGTIVTTVAARSEADYENADAEQTTTATVYLGNYKTYMTFSASTLDKAATSNVGGLVEMLDKSLFTPEVKVNTEKEKLSIETTTFYGDATLELPTVGKTYADVSISWATTSENVSITDNVLTVTAPAADTTAVITATITCGDASVTADVELTLKAAVNLPAADSELTIAEVLDLSYEGDTTDKYYVTGVVSEIYNTQYGNMYIKDADGNQLTVYGTYNADGSARFDAMDAADQPKVGDTVKFYSILSQYNGVNQLKNAWIIEVTAGEGGEVTPPADDLPAADSELTIAEVLALTYSGNTTDKYYVTGVVSEIYNTTYGNMYIKDADGNQLTVYGTYNADGTVRFDAMDAADQPKVGDTVKFYSILSQYNSVNQLKNAWIIEITAGEGGEVTPPADDLPAADSELTIAEVLALTYSGDTTDKYYVTGVITEIYNTTYGNMYIKDADGNQLTVYGTYNADGTVRFDAMDAADQPKVGDTVKFYSILSQYNSVNQLKNAWIIEVTAGEGGEVTPPADDLPAADSELTIAEVLALTYSGDTTDKYYVTGVITEIYSTTYGNMYIKDADGNQLTVYGTYNADGTARFDAMDAADQPKVGDTVKFYSILSQYNSVNQLKNAWIVEVTAHECVWLEATCSAPETCSVCGDAKSGSTTVDCVYENGVCKWCSAPEGVATITASKSMADLIASEGWNNTTTKQEFTLDDVVSVKVDGGSNSGKAYNGDHIRIYATDSPAGTLTISVEEGYELVSVKVTTLTGTYAFLCVDGETDISNVTTAVSGSSVVLTSVKNGSDGKQVRVTAIEVVYKAVA